MTMGKNKKKVDNVFKVAGARSLKLKAKAKAVKSDLKQINIKNKTKVTEIDLALNQLENKIRMPEVPLQKNTNPNSKLPSAPQVTAETEKQSEEALKNLESFQL